MTHLLILILDDLKKMPALMDAWRTVGVPGVTILQSVGAHRTRNWLGRVGLGALDRLFDSDEVQRRTLLTAIDDQSILDRAIGEAERVMDGFDRPNSGILLVVPVVEARGLNKKVEQPILTTAGSLIADSCVEWLIHRDTPVERVAAILNLEPTVVRRDTTLEEVALAMLEHPRVHVACVAADDGRLVGLLRLRSLADDLFFHIMPEEFLSEVVDLERAIQYAKTSRVRTAADAMEEPVWVKQGETIRHAFRRMHDHQLIGLPVVDDRYRITGYINLLEMLAVRCEQSDRNLEQMLSDAADSAEENQL